MVLWKCCSQYASKSGKLSSDHRTEKSVFFPISKKGNAKEYSNYCTIALISHSSKVMLKIHQARLQQYMNHELFKLDFKKAEEPEIKLTTSFGFSKRHESSIKTFTSALLTMPRTLTVWITTTCGKFWKRRITDHLTSLPRNLYVGQEATVRIRHGTADWFQNRKGVHQGCILSPCLFNLYVEYVMWNSGWMKHKLKSRLWGEMPITTDMQITPSLWQKS